jgi:hypothetical protein
MQQMDVRFCEGRDHSREATMRAEDRDREVRALERDWPRVFFLDKRLTWMPVSPQSHALPASDSPRVPIVC